MNKRGVLVTVSVISAYIKKEEEKTSCLRWCITKILGRYESVRSSFERHTYHRHGHLLLSNLSLLFSSFNHFQSSTSSSVFTHPLLDLHIHHRLLFPACCSLSCFSRRPVLLLVSIGAWSRMRHTPPKYHPMNYSLTRKGRIERTPFAR